MSHAPLYVPLFWRSLIAAWGFFLLLTPAHGHSFVTVDLETGMGRFYDVQPPPKPGEWGHSSTTRIHGVSVPKDNTPRYGLPLSLAVIWKMPPLPSTTQYSRYLQAHWLTLLPTLTHTDSKKSPLSSLSQISLAYITGKIWNFPTAFALNPHRYNWVIKVERTNYSSLIAAHSRLSFLTGPLLEWGSLDRYRLRFQSLYSMKNLFYFYEKSFFSLERLPLTNSFYLSLELSVARHLKESLIGRMTLSYQPSHVIVEDLVIYQKSGYPIAESSQGTSQRHTLSTFSIRFGLRKVF